MPPLRHLEALAGTIEGWLSEPEGRLLYELARNCTGRGVIVEIGSWKGRSTIALAIGLRDGGGTGVVYAIDPHTAEPDRPTAGPPVTVDDFNRNIRRAGIASKVELLLMTSHAARPQFRDGSVDVLFVDGSHQYEDVLQDIRDWQNSMRPGSIVAFNDPHYPGVYRALREQVLKRGPFRQPRLIDNTLFLDFQPTRKWGLGDEIKLSRAIAGVGLRFQAMYIRPRMPMILVRIGRQLIYGLVGGR